MDRDLLEELVAACVERVESGETDALETLCDDHPEYALELRRQVDGLRAMGIIGPVGATPELPPRLGGFRILDRLGGGGMGVVYRAEQEELGREVALKVIRAEYQLSEQARARFRREALAVSRLQHPGIVTIHDVGEDAGIPYIAMEYLEGWTVSRVLRHFAGRSPAELSGAALAAAITGGDPELTPYWAGLVSASWTDLCLGLIRDVAEALDHAHTRGVLHRDVKPANLMITRTGRIVLFDFGIAREETLPGLTRTGAQPGSLPYMAPEQVRGEAVDLRCDVYGAGVTLHELLGLRPAFVGEHAEDTRRRVLEGRSAPLRGTTFEAATICLTAMDRDHARRYPSAAALARDAESALARRPIRARRAGGWLRLCRWAERNPAPAIGAVLGAVIAIGAVAFAVREAEAGRALRSQTLAAERARSEALAERDAAQMTADFVNLLTESTAAWRWAFRSDEARAKFDQEATRIATTLDGRPVQLARFLEVLADASSRFGRHDAALDHTRRALDIWAQEGRELDRVRVLRLLVRHRLAADRGDDDGLVDACLAAHREHHPRSSELADALVLAAQMKLRGGDLAASRPLLDEAADVVSEVGDVDGVTARIAHQAASLALRAGDATAAVEHARRAWELTRIREGEGTANMHVLARQLTWALMQAGELTEGLVFARENEARGRFLFVADSAECAQDRALVGYLLARLGRLEEARPWLESAARDLERFSPAFAPLWLRSRAELASVQFGLEDWAGAAETARTTVDRVRELAAVSGPTAHDRALSQALLLWGRALRKGGDEREFAVVLREAATVLAGIPDLESRGRAILVRVEIASELERAGDPVAALDEARTALGLADDLPEPITGTGRQARLQLVPLFGRLAPPDERLAVAVETLDLFRDADDIDTPSGLSALRWLAYFASGAARLDLAQRAYGEAILVGEKLEGESAATVLQDRRNRARVARGLLDWTCACEELGRVVAILAGRVGDPTLPGALLDLARATIDAGAPAVAAGHYARALDAWVDAGTGPQDESRAAVEVERDLALLASGRPGARDALAASTAVLEGRNGAEDALVLRARAALAVE